MKSTSKKSIVVTASLLCIAAVVFTFQSCVKDNFKFDKMAKSDWNPNFAIPLVYSSLTIQDLLTKGDKEGLISVGSDKFCTLIYEGNLFSLSASELLNLPDQPAPATMVSLTPAEIAALNAVGTVTVSNSQTVNFVTSPSTTKIDSMSLKTGSLDISLSSDFKFNGQITLKIPGAKKNGVPFSKVLPIVYSGSVPVIANPSYDLSGYTFDMTLGGTTFNQFTVNFDITLTGTGAVATGTESITLNESLSNMKFSKIFGDIGQLSMSPDKDTVEIAIFRNTPGVGNFSLVDPSVKVLISNSYGVPIGASISQLDGYNPPSTYPITGSPNPLPILSPNLSQVGQSLTGSFTLNSSNSNIKTVINNTPQFVIYQVNSQSNPATLPAQKNFVLDTSRFKVDMQVNLPLWGTAKDFVLVDTMEFSLDQTISDNVESILFRVNNSNGFPVDFVMQCYFTDTLYNKLDSLLVPSQVVLRSGLVSTSTGMVASPTKTITDIVINKARLGKLKNSKFILVKAVAATANGGSTDVKIYSDYKLDLRFGVQLQVKAKI